MSCTSTPDGRTCEQHGSRWPCTTQSVLQAVSEERVRQFARYGTNEQCAYGTGPETRWALPASAESAESLETMFREDYVEWEEESGEPLTWVHLVREEVAEAFKEDNPGLLAEELIQVAALCVSWVEKIRERMQWGVLSSQGDVVQDPSWHCPADVMRSTHGFDSHGPYTLVFRYSDTEDWRELPCSAKTS